MPVGFLVTPFMAAFMTCPTLRRNSVAEEAIHSLGKHSAALTTTLYFLFS